MYWFFCLCTIFLFVAIATTFSGDLKSAGEMFAGIWRQYSTAVLASVFLLPLVIWDVIKFSHRVVGPILRLQQELQKLADGQPVQPLQFRTNDFWHPLAEQFNRVAAAQNELRGSRNDQNSFTTVVEDTVGQGKEVSHQMV
jgi:nitrate/nitrite-specific signal transduction histidine kinase